MDFHSLSRRELQALSKMNKIPANSTNAAMADALKALQFVEGLEDFTRLPQKSPEKIAVGLSDAPQTAFRASAPTKPIKQQLESVQPGTRTRTRTRGRSRKAGEDTVQKAQGTRRSTRLTKKAGSSPKRGKMEAVKIDDFSKETETDPEEPSVQKPEESDDLDELPKKSGTGPGASLENEGDSQNLDEGREIEPSVQNPVESDDLDELPKKGTGLDTSLENEGDSQDLDEGREKLEDNEDGTGQATMEGSQKPPTVDLEPNELQEESDDLDSKKIGTVLDTSVENEDDTGQATMEASEKPPAVDREKLMDNGDGTGLATMESYEKPPAADLEINELQENEAVKIDDFCDEMGTNPEEPSVQNPEESDDLDSKKISTSGTVLETSVESEDGTGHSTMEGSDKPPAVDREKLIDNGDGTGQATMESYEKPPAVDLEINELQENEAVKIDDFCEEMGTNPEAPSVQNPEESDDPDSKKIGMSGTVLYTSVDNEDGTGQATMEGCDKPPAMEEVSETSHVEDLELNELPKNEAGCKDSEEDEETVLDTSVENEDGTGQATMEGCDKPPAMEEVSETSHVEDLELNELSKNEAGCKDSEEGLEISHPPDLSEVSDAPKKGTGLDTSLENEGDSQDLDEGREKLEDNEDGTRQATMEGSQNFPTVDLEPNELQEESDYLDSKKIGTVLDTSVENEYGTGHVTMEGSDKDRGKLMDNEDGVEQDTSLVNEGDSDVLGKDREELMENEDGAGQATMEGSDKPPGVDRELMDKGEGVEQDTDEVSENEGNSKGLEEVRGKFTTNEEDRGKFTTNEDSFGLTAMEEVSETSHAVDLVLNELGDCCKDSEDGETVMDDKTGVGQTTMEEGLKISHPPDLSAVSDAPNNEAHYNKEVYRETDDHKTAEKAAEAETPEKTLPDDGHYNMGEESEVASQNIHGGRSIVANFIAEMVVKDHVLCGKATKESHFASDGVSHEDSEPSDMNLIREMIFEEHVFCGNDAEQQDLEASFDQTYRDDDDAHKISGEPCAVVSVENESNSHKVSAEYGSSSENSLVFKSEKPLQSLQEDFKAFREDTMEHHREPLQESLKASSGFFCKEDITEYHREPSEEGLKASSVSKLETEFKSASKHSCREEQLSKEQSSSLHKVAVDNFENSLDKSDTLLDHADEEKIDVLTSITANGYDPDQTLKKSATKTPMSLRRIPVMDKNMEKTHGRKPLPRKTPTRAPMTHPDEEKIDVLTANGCDLQPMSEVANPIPSSQIMDGAQFSSHPDQTLKKSATKTPMSLQRMIRVSDKNMEKTHGRKPLLSKTPIRAPMTHPDQPLKMSATKTPTPLQRMIPVLDKNMEKTHDRKPLRSKTPIRAPMAHPDQTLKMSATKTPTSLQRTPMTHNNTVRIAAHVRNNSNKENICKGSTDVKVKKNLNDMSRELKKSLTDTSSGDMDQDICKGGTGVKVKKNLNDMSIRELKKMIKTKDQAARAKMATPVEKEAATEN